MKKLLIALLLAGVALAGRGQITPATALSINLGTRNLQNSQADALGYNVPGNWPVVFLSGSSQTFNSGSTLTVNTGATVNGLVTQIIAGTNVTITPSGGTGAVTINSTAAGTPGGSTTQLQYNNGGVFGGTSGLTWSGTGLALAASGAISVFDLSNANVGGDSLIRFTNDQGARLYSAVLGSTFAGTTAGISNNNLALITTSQTGGTYPSALMFGTGNGAPVYLMANNTNYIKLDGSGNTSLPLLTTNGVVTTNSGIGNLSSTTSLSGISVSGAAGSFTTLSASSTVSGTGFSTYLASPPAIGGTMPSTGAFTTLSASSTVNGLTLTANATGFQIAGGTTSKTAVFSNSLTFAGTDATTMTFPSTSATIARTDAANTFTGASNTTSWNETTPVIIGGLTASGSGANTFAGSTGTFITSTGANTLSGATTINDATTPSLTTASGKTNTGFVQINGKTSGAFKLITADATAQTVTLSLAAQTVGAATLTIPDQAGTARNLVTDTGTATLTGKTFDTAGSGNNFKVNGNLISGVTGSGANVVLATSPTLTTPSLGVATATSINGNTFTTGTYTLTGVTAKTLTFNNSLTLAGTDATTMTFPSTSATIARTDAGNTFTGHQTIEGVTSTGATGTGNLVFSASPTFTGTISAAAITATGAITPSQTAGIVGTTTNNNANAGSVGEYVSSTVVDASAVALTAGVAADITSISLTAGDWDVSGLVMLDDTGMTNLTNFFGWCSTTSATLPSLDLAIRAHFLWSGSGLPAGTPAITLPTQRFSLSTTTTVYFSAYCNYTTSPGNAKAFGMIRARRIR